MCFVVVHIGMNTISGLMREEFDKYRQQIISQIDLEERMNQNDQFTGSGINCRSAKSSTSSQSCDDSEYDDLYSTLSQINMLPPAPQPPSGSLTKSEGPSLPPRNDPGNGNITNNFRGEFNRSKCLSLAGKPSDDHRNAALSAAIQRVVKLSGGQWKKLAHALPIDVTAARVSERVMSIEAAHPSDVEKQSAMAMAEWRVNARSKGGENLDSLILALRTADMHDIISDIEQVASEFTV